VQPNKANELRALFQDALHRREDSSILYKATRLADNDGQKCRNYTIYPFHCLGDLLTRLRLTCPTNTAFFDYDDDYKESHSVRFVVRPTGEIVFSPEGQIGSNRPSHAQLSEYCLASGVIVFSDDYSEIIEITNKSGHHLPNESSFLWPLAILFQLGASFASDIKLTIIKHDDTYSQSALFCSFDASIDELRGLLPENLPDFTGKNQASVVETVSLVSLHDAPFSSFGVSIGASILDDLLDDDFNVTSQTQTGAVKTISGSSSNTGIFSQKKRSRSEWNNSNESTNSITSSMTTPPPASESLPESFPISSYSTPPRP
jgi:hypothetical protein